MRTTRQQRKGQAKKNGIAAASNWLKESSVGDCVRISGYDFEYGETLSGLKNLGFDIPDSNDIDFSWGFFRKVKSHTFHCVYEKHNSVSNLN